MENWQDQRYHIPAHNGEILVFKGLYNPFHH